MNRSIFPRGALLLFVLVPFASYGIDRATIITAKGGFCWAAYSPWHVVYKGLDHQEQKATTNIISEVVSDGFRIIQTNEVVTTYIRHPKFAVGATNSEYTNNLPSVKWSIAPNDECQTISADGVVDASKSTNKNYTVTATAYDGTKQSYTMSYAYTSVSTNRYVAYVADLEGSLRDRINNEYKAQLQAATFVKYDSRSNRVWRTFVCPTANTRTPGSSGGVGNVALWALSKHILVSANHYPYKWTGNYQMTDGVTTSTLKKLSWVRLYDWALSHGFTEEGLSSIKSIGDISVVPCDKNGGEVPDGCIPYFMTPEQREAYFGDDMNGVPCWESVQDYNWAVPKIISGIGSWTLSTTAARLDIADILNAMSPIYYAYSGDSGKCLFILMNGKPVITSAHYGVYSGPDYIGAYYVLKAYAEAYGDELKTLTDEDFVW